MKARQSDTRQRQDYGRVDDRRCQKIVHMWDAGRPFYDGHTQEMQDIRNENLDGLYRAEDEDERFLQKG